VWWVDLLRIPRPQIELDVISSNVCEVNEPSVGGAGDDGNKKMKQPAEAGRRLCRRPAAASRARMTRRLSAAGLRHSRGPPSDFYQSRRTRKQMNLFAIGSMG
jgi:hypothetical protein